MWLVPNVADNESLSGIIDAQASALSSPRFEPHITFLPHQNLAKDEILSRTASLADRLSPFTAYLDSLHHSDAFYRAVYVAVRQTPELMTANSQAQQEFGLKTDFFPHLSLVYGEYSSEKRDAIASRITGYPISFGVDSIAVADTSGKEESWRSIASFTL